MNAVLLLLAMAVASTLAYPALYLEEYAKSCTSHPEEKHDGHAAPVINNGLAFTVSQSGKPNTKLCPGANTVQVSGAGSVLYLLTASAGSFTPVQDSKCPNRIYTTGMYPATPSAVTLTVPCSASSITMRVTTAAGEKSGYQTASTTLPVDPGCGAC
ncbi:hypothetical protein V8C86DRAFT_2548267 [Haematococcus lacustris]